MDRDTAIQLVQRAIKEHEDIDQMEYLPDSTLRDIGSDSLDVVEMIMLVEEYIETATKKSFAFPTRAANELTTKNTINELVAMVEQYGPTVSVSTTTKTIQ